MPDLRWSGTGASFLLPNSSIKSTGEPVKFDEQLMNNV